MDRQLVWLKRDLRLDDHAALCDALAAGPTLVLYVWEPGFWSRPEQSACHALFVRQCLDEVDAGLRALGHRLIERTGPILEVLSELHAETDFRGLWSHEETGLGWTFGRDKAVARWCEEHRVTWTERAQHGVFRRQPTRDGWARRWTERMSTRRRARPDHLPALELPELSSHRPELAELGLGEGKPEAILGGEHRAIERLDSFLETRHLGYRRAMSSPNSAWTGCSRLAPDLAWGSVSMRTVWQRTQTSIREHREGTDAREDLDAFESRLRWRDHFTQKLEDEPAIEFRNMHRAYDRMRRSQDRWIDQDHERFHAWIDGRTGLPMVDAVMRALHRGGWINFRMRAMLASVATYHLWLDWRPCAVALAPHFLDLEPGIHFAQFQMQAGTAGINTNRIYSPRKQVLDQDPKGVFIRRYVEELAHIPDAYLAEPWRAPRSVQIAAGCIIGEDYPAPVVDPVRAAAAARRRVEEVRRSAGHGAEAQRVQQRHGSRRRRPRRRW